MKKFSTTDENIEDIVIIEPFTIWCYLLKLKEKPEVSSS